MLLVLLFGPFVYRGMAQDVEQMVRSKPLQFYGSLSLMGGPYLYLGKGTPRSEPFWWNVSGAPSLSIYGWNIPFSFTFGPQQRSYSQPFNRYGVSPRYKWLTLHAGYRSISLSPYVANGVQFLGGGIELNPPGFRFAIFYGMYSRPVAFDSLASISPIPAYRRIGYGGRIGGGNRRSYFDLLFFRAEDDTNSLQQPAGVITSVTPKENVVLGLSSRIAMGRYLSWQMDGAGSLMNLDTRYSEIPVEGLPPFAKRLFTPRLGATLLFAGSTSLQFQHRRFGLRVQLRQVDPGYQSLGAYYQQSDLRALTVEPSLRLWKNKVRLSGSIGRQQDNLYNRKHYTSIRTIGSASLSLNYTKNFGSDFSFSNYGLAQQAGLQVINDTFRVAQVNRTFGTTQRYNHSDKVRALSVSLSANFQQLVDLNTINTNPVGNEVWYASLFASRMRQRDQLSLNGGANISRNETPFGTTLLLGPTLGAGKAFRNNTLRTMLNITFNKGYLNGTSSGSTVSAAGSLMYRLSAMHQFQFTLNVLHNSTPFVTAGSFTEIRCMGGYTFVFQPKK